MPNQFIEGCEAHVNVTCPYQAQNAPQQMSQEEGVKEYTDNGWYISEKGKTFNFERAVIFAGSTMTIQKELPFACRIDRISYYFSATNAKTFNTRIYASKATAAAYETLDKKSGSTETTRQWTPIHPETNKYLHPRRLEWNISSFTADDVLTLQVQVTRL